MVCIQIFTGCREQTLAVLAESQYGANILAKQGLSAEEIVQHYFSNTTVGYYDG